MLLITVFTTVNLYADKFTYNEKKLGGDFKLIFYASEKDKADLIAHQTYLLVDSLNEIFSNYLKNSEISVLNKNGKLKNASFQLAKLLQLSQQAHLKTNGYFDVSVKPLIEFWNKAEKRNKFPSEKSLIKQQKFIGLNSVLTITNSDDIYLKRKSQLDLGGIAKGYIIDEVYAFLKKNNITSFLIEAAGDIRVFGSPENTDFWNVGVSATNSKNYIVALKSGQAIATSGKTYRFRIIEGKKYSHIVNPKTLAPVSHNLTSSVIANSAIEADYLASTFNITMDKDEIEKIINNHKNIELLIFNKHDIIFATSNFFKTNNK
ncbi:FAD:protein FMN transferase [Lacinutrix himadriensis]|uniref:FAD:protein FMN transferase n=1 Tax=Lacinutrix himadriensis TaxID=641549 RepID=UPI0006E13F58|nr:FAD:protein FMN transferase [Lacinutrix himadriensis]